MSDDRLAVVVITHDRREELLQSLARLRSLPERPAVVVVDNGSTDGTAGAVASAFPDVRMLDLSTNVGAAARNRGVALVGAPYVAFCDDDTWWEPGSLSAASDLFDANPRLGVVTARIVVEPRGTVDPICHEMRWSPLPAVAGLPGYPILSFLAGASAVRRAPFVELGGFEPHLFFGGEEELLAVDLAAAGWHLAYVPELVVHHQASPRRSPDAYRTRGIRNTLWCTWLRRPLPSAARRTLGVLRRLPADRVAVGGVARAVAGLPWVVRHRRVVPPDVERGLRLLDGPQLSSEARQYVH
ncbi:MAG: glycosyltransferase family 2 protein [Acidimicrobiales bacterium]